MSELRDLRRATGLGQREFAALLSVALETFRTWDSGRRGVPAPVLQRARAVIAHHERQTELLPNATGTVGVQVPGCAVADDFDHALGDRSEGRLAAALGYLANGSCPAVSASRPGVRTAQAPPLREGLLYKSPWRENRILRR